MDILVTGTAGRIGRYVAADLMAAGHIVRGVDVNVGSGGPCPTLRADLTDAGQVYQALAWSRAEAVVHLGAWANAGLVPDTRTYADNVEGTFNVLQACADTGVRRVVSASSAQVYGLAQAPPECVPLDEAHPLRPGNCYALSKIAGEQAADYFSANRDVTVVSFRFMGVRTPDELNEEIDRMVRAPARGTGLLWTRTDARDAALACRLALEADRLDPGPYNITGTRVVLEEPSLDLVARHLGGGVEIRGDLPGSRSPMSFARAEAAFRYRPKYTWSVSERFPEQDGGGSGG
jgi:nucleoside-diphosphate-sugar epimerase